MNRTTLAFIISLITATTIAQNTDNVISTATPFLTISPDSRSSAMGDVGVSTSPDFNSQTWNAAKYPFIGEDFGFTFSYTPWLRELVNDIGLFYLAGHYKINDLQAVSASMRYFSLGEIQWTDQTGEEIAIIRPNEFAIDAAYSRLFSEHLSGAVAFRFIYSDLSGGATVQGSEDFRPGATVTADISSFYTNEMEIRRYETSYNIGLSITNLGNKMSYIETEQYFLPTTLRLGTTWGMVIDEYNKLSATLELSKLLVPTPGGYDSESDIADAQERNDMNVLVGAINSFSDAPGGSSEEFQEIMWSAGLEYIYDDIFFLRGGYYYEHENKGNRTFFAAGAGFKLNVMSLDVSYLIPTDSTSPLANTIRFTLSFGVEGLQKLINGN